MAVTVAIPTRLTGDTVIAFSDTPFVEYVVDAAGLQFVERQTPLLGHLRR